MIIGSLALELRLEACHSLKEKRAIIKSVIARLRNEFNVAVAEVAEHDKWQLAVLGVACVSNKRDHARRQLDAVVDWIYEHRPDVDVIGTEIEILA